MNKSRAIGIGTCRKLIHRQFLARNLECFVRNISSIFGAHQVSFKLTKEQERIVEAVNDPSRPNVTVVGYAGAAKTTTMLSVAKRKDEDQLTGSAFFFNKAMADDMARKIKTDRIVGLSSSTLHSLAYRDQARRFGNRVGKPIYARDILKAVPVEGSYLQKLQRFMTPNAKAYLGLKSLSTFCHSDDAKFTDKHLSLGDYAIHDGAGEVADKTSESSRRIAEFAMNLDNGLGMNHDVYLKNYIEGVCDGRYQGPGGQYLIGDEFQDSNGITMKFMRHMASEGRQIIVAGDPNQQIYRWRGSVNAMDRLKTDIRLELTQSFRFGQAIADAASQVLRWLGNEVSLKGAPGRVSTINGRRSDGDMAVICRTNAGIVESLKIMLDQGRTCYAPRAQQILDEVLDVIDLQNGIKASRTALRIFKDYDDFESNVEDGATEFLMLLNLCEEYGTTLLTRLLHDSMHPKDGAVTLLTAHSSKGLEFDNVILGSDFPDERKFYDLPHDIQLDEMRLLYVAMTRAKFNLDMRQVPLLLDVCGVGRSGRAAARFGS
ncbi:UvrD-helicase domain-containing protein [Sinimarinibacterium sp. NLF-5-8]|uniref:UvrD-helicase domain-containing protein n=1 Tax=Sinimarinibacterium sp. NLF-5-8 TaxID=2698684 RepID=UPI001EE44D91|nr:ATP-dependent helicase [Sinimarinibacterium sp. NLF-5-8]